MNHDVIHAVTQDAYNDAKSGHTLNNILAVMSTSNRYICMSEFYVARYVRGFKFYYL